MDKQSVDRPVPTLGVLASSSGCRLRTRLQGQFNPPEARIVKWTGSPLEISASKYVLTRILPSLTKRLMPLVYVFAASKMEAQPVLVLAGQNGATGQGSAGLIIEHGDGRFAVIITGMGTRNAEVKAEAALGLGVPGADGGSSVA